MNKHKLELTWIGKDVHPILEPRILLEDPKFSFGDSKDEDTQNYLIHGDNLLALKALESTHTGRVKCVFIDPPYNTGSAFEHYDDGLEHSIWLSMMRLRLEILRSLLSEDGSLWISIDDNEAHYLKVLLDEIFGRKNFVRNIVWQKKYAAANDAKGIPDSHDHILVYQKSPLFNRNLLPRTEKQNSLYKFDSEDGKGPWRSDNLSVKTYSKEYDYPIINPNTGKVYYPPKGRAWLTNRITMQKWIDEKRVFFGQKGDGAPQLKRYLSEVQQGVLATSWWTYEECGHNDESRKESKTLFGDNPFSTPKPERLLYRIITLATKPGDIVLDSFAGSGTTGAVAHKMGRRWIMVELGDHCFTHIIPRLKKVINGKDNGGITDLVNWQGGGSYKYFHLAPSLLQKDKWGNWVVNKLYNAEMLTEALCKLEGFVYAPSSSEYWKHGFSTESDFIYVTTESLNHEQLRQMSNDVGPNQSLLILCTSFRSDYEFNNLTIKKIPKNVLNKCEWGRDDYSLNIIQDLKPVE